MKQYLYIALVCSLIAIWAAMGIGCIANTCEIRAISTAMSFKTCDIPHRLAVGKEHVAVQVLKNGEWKFVHVQDAKCFQPVEFVNLQRYMKYLIIRYNTLEKFEEVE